MNGKYILALDQGTTSSRVILFDRDQNILGVSQKEFTQHYPHEGWVEHDAMEIWSSQYATMMEVVAQSGVAPEDIAGIGITNQRETTILWDKETGRPVSNAIVWQCRRTAPLVDRLLADGLDSFRKNCLEGLRANREKMGEYLDRSLMLVTCLTPRIGYEKAAQAALLAHREGISLREAVLRAGLLTEAEYGALVDPEKMV